MIDTQLLLNVILALAVLIGITAVLSGAIQLAAAVSRPAPPPPGGIRRHLPPEPEPEPEPDTDDARELVLL